MTNRQYHSLDDFLATHPLTVDGHGNDGGDVTYTVKGIEIEASVLFSDISNFSGRTFDMSPSETLAFVNHFFTWISEEALRGRPGIIDKYIGDEIMVVFSREFGSEDPFLDAVLSWFSVNWKNRVCELVSDRTRRAFKVLAL
jgi:class 3 adenylate cyclase